jgi:hypothetical protein
MTNGGGKKHGKGQEVKQQAKQQKESTKKK